MNSAPALPRIHTIRDEAVVLDRDLALRRELLADATMEARLSKIDKTLLNHDTALRDLYAKLRPLLRPPSEPPKRRIGFHRLRRRNDGLAFTLDPDNFGPPTSVKFVDFARLSRPGRRPGKQP